MFAAVAAGNIASKHRGYDRHLFGGVIYALLFAQIFPHTPSLNMGWWSGTWPKYDQSLPLSMACCTFRVPFLKFKFWFSMMRVNSQVLTPTLLAHSAIALSVSTVSTMGTVIVQPAQMKTIYLRHLRFWVPNEPDLPPKFRVSMWISDHCVPEFTELLYCLQCLERQFLWLSRLLRRRGLDCYTCSFGGCSGCRGTNLQFPAEPQNERGINSQKAINCFGQQFNLNFPVQCPGYPAHSGSPAINLGCAINYTALNDNNCNCPTCSCGVFSCRGSSNFLPHLIFHHVLVQHGEMSHDPPLLMWKKGTPS